MSELTRCNYCSLRSIQQKGKQAGVRTYVKDGKGEWNGWKVVTYSGESQPVAYFMDLTDHCVC